jgi:hypothetical protein
MATLKDIEKTPRTASVQEERTMSDRELVSEEQRRARIVHDEESWLKENRTGHKTNRLNQRGKGRALELMVGYFNP